MCIFIMLDLEWCRASPCYVHAGVVALIHDRFAVAMSKPTTEIDLSGFGLERLQHIGRGQYASAQLVKETASGQTFVAKCISLAALNEHDQDLAHQEVFLLQTLSHPYIVAYRDSFLIEGANTLVIVMEYCGGGDVRKAIKDKAKEGGHFTEEQIMTWFVQLCLALQYIHSEKVLHRDLKTSNIFLTEDGSAIKLGDFGISRVLEGTTEAAVTIVGTPYYMSPEVCRSEPYNWKSDIWALGCVLYECCMLKHAFESSSLLGLVYKIVSDHYDPIPSFYSPELNDLINKLLMKNAESRPSINELFANPYVKAYLAKQSAPVAVPSPPASSLEPAGKKTTLRPGGAAKPPPPPPPPPKESPPAPGPAPLAPESKILVIIARIRRRLVGQKLNWISSCASFDDDGDGALTPDAMGHALMTMPLGLSDDEIKQLTSALSPSPGAKISLDAFSAYLQEVADEVKQYETWARQVLAPPGKRLHDLLRAKDIERSGTLAPSIFQDTLQELVPVLTPPHLDLLALLADKNCLGDVDYGEFLDTFGAPVAPPSSAPPGPPRPPAPPGMPPLPGMSAAPAPPGMPPLPGVGGPSDPLGATLGGTLGGTLGSVEINFEKTFFTCTSSSALQGTNAGRMSLSAQGCALIFGRLRRRLEAAGLALSDALALFLLPGERELTAEQWLDVASTLPLGTSRAEMQQLFLKVDADSSGKVALTTLEQGIARANSEDCCKPPTWISAAITQRGLCNRISVRLRALPRALKAPAVPGRKQHEQGGAEASSWTGGNDWTAAWTDAGWHSQRDDSWWGARNSSWKATSQGSWPKEQWRDGARQQADSSTRGSAWSADPWRNGGGQRRQSCSGAAPLHGQAAEAGRYSVRGTTAKAKTEKPVADHEDDDDAKALGVWEVAFQLAEADVKRIASATEPLPVFQATCDVTELKQALSSLFPVIPGKVLHNTAVLWNLVGIDEVTLPTVVTLQGASLGYLPEGPGENEALLQAVARSITTPTGQSGIHIVGEAFLEDGHTVVQAVPGGRWRLPGPLVWHVQPSVGLFAQTSPKFVAL
eukprot:s846_g26.t1